MSMVMFIVAVAIAVAAPSFSVESLSDLPYNEDVREIAFEGLTLSPNNDLLFRARARLPEYGPYNTLFRAQLSDDGEHIVDQLSFFPEEVSLLSQTRQLQIQNRFGVFRTDEKLNRLAPLDGISSFVNGKQIETGKIAPLRSSPDGRFLLYLQDQSAAYGDLILHDLSTGRRFILVDQIGISLAGPPVSWSPDSDYFVYSKDRSLYYFSIAQLLDNQVLSEELRRLGEGTVASAKWGRDGELYYISGTLVYRIVPSELFTRNLYADLFRVGRILGKVPFNFDPNFDSYWISPGGEQILFNKGGRGIFLYVLRNADFYTTGDSINLPYLFLPRNTTIKRVLWSKSNWVTLLAGSLRGQHLDGEIYRMKLQPGTLQFSFDPTEDERVVDIVLSPNELMAAVLFEDRVIIKNYNTWEDLQVLPHARPLHVVWNKSNRLIIAGARVIEQVDLVNARNPRLIALSHVDAYGFGEDITRVKAIVDGRPYQFNGLESGWRPLPEGETALEYTEQHVSGSYRVYLQPFTSGSYRNIVMIRDNKGFGTTPLFSPVEERYESFPNEDQPIDFGYFVHGSRLRRRETAFVFNAIDAAEGLTQVLDTLRLYKIRATFFLNGEFIQRNPEATMAIADAGHEMGSLFFNYFDMTDTRFKITKDFIKAGLARNEDLYFDATNRELSLLWHAPYYFINPEILRASQELNYVYIGRDVDSFDWIPLRGTQILDDFYQPSSDIIEHIIERKQPGSIIAMRIGIPREDRPFGGRDDYLFQHLDLLINRLTERGFSIVTVSELIEGAR